MIDAIQTGVQGMDRATRMVDNAASEIARAATPAAPSASSSAPRGDIPRGMVGLVVGQTAYTANAQVITVGSRMLSTLFDAIA